MVTALVKSEFDHLYLLFSESLNVLLAFPTGKGANNSLSSFQLGVRPSCLDEILHTLFCLPEGTDFRRSQQDIVLIIEVLFLPSSVTFLGLRELAAGSYCLEPLSNLDPNFRQYLFFSHSFLFDPPKQFVLRTVHHLQTLRCVLKHLLNDVVVVRRLLFNFASVHVPRGRAQKFVPRVVKLLLKLAPLDLIPKVKHHPVESSWDPATLALTTGFYLESISHLFEGFTELAQPLVILRHLFK